MDIEGDIILRDMKEGDDLLLDKQFDHNSYSSYTSYYEQAVQGASEIIIAECNNEIIGYAKLDWQSSYDDFEEEQIPEIKELYVREDYRSQGVASKLMNELEVRAATKSEYCAIGVGLAEAYEPAQRLLAKRGYEPDGKGIFYIETGSIHDELEVDDNQALMMIKRLI